MDPESKLFYRKLLDFGPGVGFREGRQKFEEEKRIEDEVRSNLNPVSYTHLTLPTILRV